MLAGTAESELRSSLQAREVTIGRAGLVGGTARLSAAMPLYRIVVERDPACCCAKIPLDSDAEAYRKFNVDRAERWPSGKYNSLLRPRTLIDTCAGTSTGPSRMNALGNTRS
jgi:hypothetical protein